MDSHDRGGMADAGSIGLLRGLDPRAVKSIIQEVIVGLLEIIVIMAIILVAFL